MKYIKTSLLYAVYLFASSLIAFVIMIPMGWIINAIWTSVVLRDVLYVLGIAIFSGIVLFIVFYRNGYKDNNGYDAIVWRKIYITIIISLVIALVINIISGFAFIFDMRGTTSLILTTHIASDYDSWEGLQPSHFPIAIISYIMQMGACIPFMAVGYYIGHKKRGKDRDEIMHKVN